MSREQLEAFAHRLKGEMDREREERNFFQMERDKLRTFWEITRAQLDEARAVVRNKDREVEVAHEMAELDIKNVMQQMKHLEYENQTRLCEMRAEFMTQMQQAQENHGAQEQEIMRDKRELREMLREKGDAQEMALQEYKLFHCQALVAERTKFERELEEMLQHNETKFQAYVSSAGLRHRMELEEVEERKNDQIRKLIETHDQAYDELKTYHSQITSEHLALIGSLKEQVTELRQSAEKHEKSLTDLTAENRRLQKPLSQSNAELAELRNKMEHFERDRLALARAKARCATAEKLLDQHKWETEELRMQVAQIGEERDALKMRFEEAVLELQQKTGLKNVLLERKIALLEQETEKREAVFGEVLASAGLEPHTLSTRIEKLLQMKNDKIQELKLNVIKANRRFEDLQSRRGDGK